MFMVTSVEYFAPTLLSLTVDTPAELVVFLDGRQCFNLVQRHHGI